MRQWLLGQIVALGLFAVVVVSGHFQGLAWADGDSMRLHTMVDETSVRNMDARSMRVAVELQHPGLAQWKHWRLEGVHPQTGEILSCYRKQKEECRHFPNYAHYSAFRVAQFQAAEVAKFRR